MNREKTTEDPTLLLVAGRGDRDKKENKLYIQKLSNAILKVVDKHGIARLRCIGAYSVNNGIKAFIIANQIVKNTEHAKPSEDSENSETTENENLNKELIMDPNFVNVVLEESEVTGILIEITYEGD